MANESYRRVVPSFWTDPDMRPLRPVEKLVFLYFCSSPHSNMIGLYHCPLEYAAREAGVSVSVVKAAIAGPLAPFLAYDDTSEEVLVFNAARHQIERHLKATDKRLIGVRRLVQAAHSPALVHAFLERYADWEIGVPMPESAKKAPKKEGASKGHQRASEGNRKGPSKGSVQNRTEQEHAQEQNRNKAHLNGATSEKPKPAEPPSWVARFGDAWKRDRGEPNYGRIGKVLAPLVRAHGEYQVWLAWDGYLESRSGKEFAGAEHFAENYALYRDKWAVIVGPDGSETPVPDHAIEPDPEPVGGVA